jgi:hypothetical protein
LKSAKKFKNNLEFFGKALRILELFGPVCASFFFVVEIKNLRESAGWDPLEVR